ncbi:MAG: P-loop NTPase fold protein, partial [Thermoguttaceae bacterium]
YPTNTAVTAAAHADAIAAAAAVTAATTVAIATDIRKSLRSIYETLLNISSEKMTILRLQLWSENKCPGWFIDALKKNRALQQYWEENKLNPWGMLDIAKGKSKKTHWLLLKPLSDEPTVPQPSKPESEPTDSEQRIDSSSAPETLTPVEVGTQTILVSKSSEFAEPCLHINEIADALSDVLDNSQTAVCFGIFGRWGRGKTHLARQVAKRLEAKKYSTIEYNAWKYRTTPESWAYLYDIFAKKLRSESWFAALRAGVIRNGLWPISLALFLIALPGIIDWVSIESNTISNQSEGHWFEILSKVLSFGGGVTLIVFFMANLFHVFDSFRKNFILPDHHDKLGLQATIGDDFIAIIRGWIPDKQKLIQKKESEGNKAIDTYLLTGMYIICWTTSLFSLIYLSAQQQFINPNVAGIISSIILCVTLIPAAVFLCGSSVIVPSTGNALKKLIPFLPENKFTHFTTLFLGYGSIAALALLFSFVILWIYGALWVPFLVEAIILAVMLFIVIICLQCRKWKTKRILLIVDDLDRCESDNILEIIESIQLLCREKVLESRLQVCMLVEERTLEKKLEEKYRSLLPSLEGINKADHLNPRIREYCRSLKQLVSENIEKIFDAHIRLDKIPNGDLPELFDGMISPLETKNNIDRAEIIIEKYISQSSETSDQNSDAESPDNRHDQDSDNNSQSPSYENQSIDSDSPTIEAEEDFVYELGAGGSGDGGSEAETQQKNTNSKSIDVSITPNEKSLISCFAYKKFKFPEGYWTPRAVQHITMQYQLARTIWTKVNKTQPTEEEIVQIIYWILKKRNPISQVPIPGEIKPVLAEIINMVIWDFDEVVL